MTKEEEIIALRAKLAELERESFCLPVDFTAEIYNRPLLKRPSEYDRQLCRLIDPSTVKDSFRQLVTDIVGNIITKQFGKASPKQRMILLRTIAGQHKVKCDFKTATETELLQKLVDAGLLK